MGELIAARHHSKYVFTYVAARADLITRRQPEFIDVFSDEKIIHRLPCFFCFLVLHVQCHLNDGRSNDFFNPYFGDNCMTNATSAGASAGASPPEIEAGTKKAVLTEIRAKWGKFSEQELSALKDNDDLVTQLVAKYSLDRPQAQRDVDAMMKGRHI